MPERIGILGAGSWGTALSILLAENGHTVTLWEFREDVAVSIRDSRQNPDVLPDVDIPATVRITSDLEDSLREKDLLVLAAPSHVVREICGSMAALSVEPVPMISVVKGIENTTLMRMSEIIQDCLPAFSGSHVAVLSGPSHAEEVSRRMPTAVVVASANAQLAERVQSVFMNGYFRVYVTDDLVGVELGGALKNVIAIASGICDGAGLGDNTKAALVTRGLAEMTRLGGAMGADPQTFMGLAGIGDLVVTCMSRHSRNRYVGSEIGKGRTLPDVLEHMVMVAEGVKTTQSAFDLAQQEGVEVPITSQVHAILFGGVDPRQAVNDLMARAPKAEVWNNKQGK